MAGDQKGELTKDKNLLLKAMNAQLQQEMEASLDKFRQEFRQELQQATGLSLESRSSERRQRREHDGRGNSRETFADQKLKIPPFYGEADPAAYVEWEEKMELIFNYQHYAERKKVQMATAEFYGYASSWWNKLRKSRRLDGKEPVETWLKLSSLMRREYVPRQYYKEVLQKQKRTRKQETQGNIKTAISDYCANISSSLEEEQVQTEVPKELENERGNNTYEEKEVSDSSHCLKDHEETNLQRNYECSHHSFHSDFFLENTQACDELTCLEPVQPSSVLSLTQLAEKDSSKEEPESTTQREQQKNLQSETTCESLSYDLQEHCKEFNMVVSVPEMFVKVSTEDIKRFGLDKVKDFCVSKSVFDNMFKSLKELKREDLFDQKRFQEDTNNISGHVFSLDQFLKHNKSFDHFKTVLELQLKQFDFCFRKPCDLFARTEKNSFVMNSPMHKLVTDNFLASTYVLKEPRKLHKPKLDQPDTRFEFVKSTKFSDFELDCLCAENDSQHVGLILEDIWVCNIYFDMMHLFLSKELSADFKRAWKHTRRNYKPPDLDQDKHQDVPGFVLIKEAPPDAAYHPKPSKNLFGIRLLLFDKSSYTNLLYFIVCESGLRNASGVWRAQHKIDLRTNPFQEGGDDMIMDQLVDGDGELKDEPAEEDGALAIPKGPMTRARSKQLKEAIGGVLKTSMKPEESLGRSLINQDTLTTIQAISSPR